MTLALLLLVLMSLAGHVWTWRLLSRLVAPDVRAAHMAARLDELEKQRTRLIAMRGTGRALLRERLKRHGVV